MPLASVAALQLFAQILVSLSCFLFHLSRFPRALRPQAPTPHFQVGRDRAGKGWSGGGGGDRGYMERVTEIEGDLESTARRTEGGMTRQGEAGTGDRSSPLQPQNYEASQREGCGQEGEEEEAMVGGETEVEKRVRG